MALVSSETTTGTTMPKRYQVEYISRYRGDPVLYEIDAVSADDAITTFLKILDNGLLEKKCYCVKSVKVAEPVAAPSPAE